MSSDYSAPPYAHGWAQHLDLQTGKKADFQAPTVPRPPQSSLLMRSSSKSSKLGISAITLFRSGLASSNSSIGSKAMSRSRSMRKAPDVLEYSPENFTLWYVLARRCEVA